MKKWKLKLQWTTKDVDTDKVIEGYETSYTYSEFLAVFNKEERELLKKGSDIIWHSRFPTAKHTGFILDSRYHELRIHKQSVCVSD